tara:strand:- start:522 stop:1043 length:522 start_codon:yes stop_codon:yes gene_type:complete
MLDEFNLTGKLGVSSLVILVMFVISQVARILGVNMLSESPLSEITGYMLIIGILGLLTAIFLYPINKWKGPQWIEFGSEDEESEDVSVLLENHKNLVSELKELRENGKASMELDGPHFGGARAKDYWFSELRIQKTDLESKIVEIEKKLVEKSNNDNFEHIELEYYGDTHRRY